MALSNDILPSDIFLLLTEKSQKFTPYLDDTLLNRLESSLYCNHVCHSSFWATIHAKYYEQILASLDETFDDLELYCGALKLKFALLWHFKLDFNSDVYTKFGNILTSVIQSEDTILCSLKTFFEFASQNRDDLIIFSAIDSEIALPLLKKKWDQSTNIIYRSSIMTALMNILFSTLLSTTGSHVSLCAIAICFACETLSNSFYQDFFTKFIIYSSRLGYIPQETAFTQHFTRLTNIFLLNRHSLPASTTDDTIYVIYLLSLSISSDLVKKICSELDEIKESLFPARILRRILLNNVFRECPISEFLIKNWYQQSLSAMEVPNGGKLRKIITPIATCACNPMQFSLFRTKMPQFYMISLWKQAILIFDSIKMNVDNSSQITDVWLLFNKLIHSPIDGMLHLGELLQHFESLFEKLVGFHFLIDCAFLLYTKCENISNFERLTIFDKVFALATRECISIETSGGTLFYSFLLLRITDYTFLHSIDLQLISPLCLKLIELQKIVALKSRSEKNSLLSNETVMSIQKGFFLVKLLDCDDLLRKDAAIAQKLLAFAVKEKDDVFSDALKGIILSCLFSCLPPSEPSLLNDLFLKTCYGLLNDGIEEDPSIRLSVSSSWFKLLERSQSSENEQLKYFVEKFTANSRSCKFLHNPASISDDDVCPNCRENLLSLLEDIIITKSSAGDTDCIGD